MKKTLCLALMALLTGTGLSFGSSASAAVKASDIAALSGMKNASVAAIAEDSRTFARDSSIDVLSVRFQNRYGFQVAGHMYLPRGFRAGSSYPAIVVTGPFGAVKEQASGLYAQEFAKHGYVAVAFDPSTTGESSGDRRNMGSPEIFTEDYGAAVDFVSCLSFVDPGRIGAMGICGLSGMAITAASSDVRIRAVATSAMYDMSESIGRHYLGAYYTPEQKEIVKKHLADMRMAEARSGKSIRGAHEIAVDEKGKALTFDTMFPDRLPEGTNEVIRGFYDYYVSRAYHPRAINSNTLAWDSTTPYGFFNFPLMSCIKEVSPRPILLITGSKAHSKYFSDNVYAAADEPKTEIVVPDATHTDLYDNMSKIPFDRLFEFFDMNLK